MGVNVNHYIMYGVRLKFSDFPGDFLDNIPDEYDDNQYSPFVSNNDIHVVADGMNGDYVFLGKIIHRTNCDDGFASPILVTLTNEEKIRIRMRIRDDLGQYFVTQEPAKFGLWIFSHYH